MKTLQAGPLRAGYENGFLRRISYGETEIIRMIYFALRDHNWNTLNHQIENENIVMNSDDFEITYDCFHLDGGVSVMEWKARISGKSNGTVTFEIEGKVTENFKRNRAGFCVLHPLNITGNTCNIVHPDGSQTSRNFPRYVAAENPFRNIQSMRWETSGTEFTLNFEGDVFETEDQRNWGDASFKTFCTPLDKPFPVQLKKGDKVFQRITFKPVSMLAASGRSSSEVVLHETSDHALLPSFGIAASTETVKLSEETIILLRALRLGHYRTDLHPASSRFAVDLSNGYENAFAAGLPLEAVLHLTENFREELDAFTVICQQNKVRLKKVLLLRVNDLVTSQEIINQVVSLKQVFPKVLFGAGTNYNFNEINKNHFNASNLDYISFSMDPQEHAVDDLTVLENMDSLAHLTESAKSIYGKEMPIHISPLTLRKRFNPYATNPDDLFIDEWKKADPRQKEKFSAVWTFGCICSLTKGRASAVTFYQTVGDQGVLSKEATPYPVYDTIKSFAPYQRKPASILESSDPFAITGLLLDGNMLAMANLTEEEKKVRWKDRQFVLSAKEIKFEPLNRA